MENKPDGFVDPNIEKKEISEAEVRARLHFYHQTTKEKWKKIIEAGAILSEKELVERGFITAEQLEDDLFDETSTGSLDREAGRDQYVFASHVPHGYGEITLELDPSILEIKGAKVAMAGDWLHYCDSEEGRKYFEESEIPASEFVHYLTKFINSLPDPEWFWGKRDEKLKELIGEGFKESSSGNSQKIRTFWSLFPEIMLPKELPLSFIKKGLEEKNN